MAYYFKEKLPQVGLLLPFITRYGLSAFKQPHPYNLIYDIIAMHFFFLTKFTCHSPMKISPSPSPPVATPAKYYPNSDICKVKILSDNQNKAGIYMWENLTNGKKYIGSAVNLRNRFIQYYSIKYLERYNYMGICRPLLKYEHENFALAILEYCEPEKCLEREDFYLSSLQHKYNILEKAGSLLGYKHSQESKTKISEAKKGITGENHPMYGKNHTDESKTIMSEAKQGKPRPKGAGKPSQQIEVTDIKNNTTTSYDSISEAARALNFPNHKAISNYIRQNQQKPYKAQYIFKKR